MTSSNSNQDKDFADRLRNAVKDVFHFALHRGQGNWHEAEEAIQEASVAAWSKQAEISLLNGHLDAFLRKCIKDFFAQRSRRRKRLEKALGHFTSDPDREWEEPDVAMTFESPHVAEALEYIERYRGWLPDDLVKFARICVEERGVRERIERRIGGGPSALRWHRHKLRRWKRDEDYKIGGVCRFWHDLLVLTLLSPYAAAGRIGRLQFSSDEYDQCVTELLPGSVQLSDLELPEDDLARALQAMFELYYPMGAVTYPHLFHLTTDQTRMLFKPCHDLLCDCLNAINSGSSHKRVCFDLAAHLVLLEIQLKGYARHAYDLVSPILRESSMLLFDFCKLEVRVTE